MANRIFTLSDYRKLKKDITIANQRIQRIQARYGEGSWSINELYNNLPKDAVSILTGGIKVNKNMSDIQLRSIAKATDNFLHQYKTSSLVGIKKAIRDTKSSLQATFSEMGVDGKITNVSNEDIEKLYKLVEDKTLRDTTEKIGASNLWASMVEAKERNLSGNAFKDLLSDKTKANIKDSNVQQFLDDIYSKYIGS